MRLRPLRVGGFDGGATPPSLTPTLWSTDAPLISFSYLRSRRITLLRHINRRTTVLLETVAFFDYCTITESATDSVCFFMQRWNSLNKSTMAWG